MEPFVLKSCKIPSLPNTVDDENNSICNYERALGSPSSINDVEDGEH